jgi:hypothetical protein
MEVEIDLETLRQNSDGDDVVIYRFRPVRNAGVAAGAGAGKGGAS